MSRLFSLYEVDLEVQRLIVPQNLAKLIDYIMLYLEGDQTIYFPGIIFSARGAGEYDASEQVLRLHSIEKLYVVDGQHRLAAFQRLTETLQSSMARAKDLREYDRMEELKVKLSKLYNFPLSVMIYMDIDARQERQLFSDINKLPRKIGGNLAVLRDQRKFYHVLATTLSETDSAMHKLTIDVFTDRGKSPEYLFSYQIFVEILMAFFEGRMKSASRNNGYHYSMDAVAEHAKFASVYLSGLLQFLPEPNKEIICWTEIVQIALGIFFHEHISKITKFDQLSLKHALRILPHVPWKPIEEIVSAKLPRKTRIMQVTEYVRAFYEENHLFLISMKEEG
jgi:DGQHR domain-containing protein